MAQWKGEITMIAGILLGIATGTLFIVLPTGVVVAWLMREDVSYEEMNRTWKRVFWAGTALASVFWVVIARMG